MEALLIADQAEQNARISETIKRESGRLRNFIRRQVADPGEVEDILQDVFAELVEAYRLLQPIEQAGAWLFRVARNRITDLFRKKKPELLGDSLGLEDLLPSPDAGPEAELLRGILLDELREALAALPAGQREVFVAHELEGVSFKELSARLGVSVNTLLSRKHYAVQALRQQLQPVFDELKKG